MGLDIKAYRNLEVVNNPKLDEDGEVVNWETEWKPGASMKWSEDNFPGRGEGIEVDLVYSWENSIKFCAGTYSSYNWWRDKLEEFAKGDEFQELIDFADNEGVIGPIVSEKLFRDFEDLEEEAEQFAQSLDETGEYWLKKYNQWKDAFEYAADNGAVRFC